MASKPQTKAPKPNKNNNANTKQNNQKNVSNNQQQKQKNNTQNIKEVHKNPNNQTNKNEKTVVIERHIIIEKTRIVEKSTSNSSNNSARPISHTTSNNSHQPNHLNPPSSSKGPHNHPTSSNNSHHPNRPNPPSSSKGPHNHPTSSNNSHHPNRPNPPSSSKGPHNHPTSSNNSHHPNRPNPPSSSKGPHNHPTSSNNSHHPNRPNPPSSSKGPHNHPTSSNNSHHPNRPNPPSSSKGPHNHPTSSNNSHHPNRPNPPSSSKGSHNHPTSSNSSNHNKNFHNNYHKPSTRSNNWINAICYNPPYIQSSLNLPTNYIPPTQSSNVYNPIVPNSPTPSNYLHNLTSYIASNQSNYLQNPTSYIPSNQSNYLQNPTSYIPPLLPKSSQPDISKQVLKDVLDSLDCPVCLEFLKSPIYICENGHDLCGSCHAKLPLPICPLCNGAIANQRNYRLEGIIEKMSTSCTNSSHGCKFRGSEEEVKSHFDECYFRQCFCPMGKEFKQCLWTGSISELKNHFTESHPKNMELKVGNEVTFDNFDIKKPDQDMQLIVFGNAIYLYHVRIDPFHKLALWGIQSWGTRKNADNVTYEFKIYNSKNSKRAILLREACQPESLCFEDIYHSGDCIAVPLHVLKTFIHDDKKLTFKFFIKKEFNSKNVNKNPHNAVANMDDDDISLLKLKN